METVDPKYDEWLATSDLGLRWLETGDASSAVKTFREAVRLEAGFTPTALADPDVRKDRAKLHFNYGVALRRIDGNSAALPEWESAAGLDPSSARYLRTLADAYRLADRGREADSLLALARQQVGGDAEVAVSEGFRAARERRFDDAVRELELAVAGDARLYGAWGALIRVRVHQERLAEADSTLRRAEAAGMPKPVATVYRGLLAAKHGDIPAARRALAESEGTQLDPTLELVKQWTKDLIAGAPRPADPDQ
jgi:tetratricopeptide (TPR) repeat protein